MIRQEVSTWTPQPTIYDYGVFPGQLISMQHFHDWQPGDVVDKIIGSKLHDLLGDFRVIECVYQELHRPWDIHCDFDRGTADAKPWYTAIVPLHACPSSTVIFKQRMDYNDFSRFKQSNAKAEQPVDQDFWQQHLDFCWPEDREWLTVDHVSQSWSPGSLLLFPRDRIHSSDNFHKRIHEPKQFIQILVDHV